MTKSLQRMRGEEKPLYCFINTDNKSRLFSLKRVSSMYGGIFCLSGKICIVVLITTQSINPTRVQTSTRTHDTYSRVARSTDPTRVQTPTRTHYTYSRVARIRPSRMLCFATPMEHEERDQMQLPICEMGPSRSGCASARLCPTCYFTTSTI
ncbi:hypothetical protein EV363DRAFT_5490 [Boletus edulis]|nr:hypothetical protein EV363DRAFT_5490 [Boletus edulis]